MPYDDVDADWPCVQSYHQAKRIAFVLYFKIIYWNWLEYEHHNLCFDSMAVVVVVVIVVVVVVAVAVSVVVEAVVAVAAAL